MPATNTLDFVEYVVLKILDEQDRQCAQAAAVRDIEEADTGVVNVPSITSYLYD